MARAPQKDLLSRLADAGEEAIQKLADMPGAQRAVDAAGGLRDRLDELQKRVRGIEELERRVAKLETGARRAQARRAGKPKPKPKTAPRKPARPLGPLGRHAQAQRARHDLEAHRRRSRLLAVELHRQRHVGVHGDDRPRSSSAFGCGRCVPR